MVFVQLSDIVPGLITQEALDQITLGDGAFLDRFEKSAIEKAKGYLGGRFDFPAILANTTTRNQLFVDNLAYLILYWAHGSISYQNTPKDVVDKYNEAVTWFKEVGGGEQYADLPQVDSETVRYSIRYGSSQPKLDHYY